MRNIVDSTLLATQANITGDVSLITLEGELDRCSAKPLKEFFARLLLAQHCRLVLDLAGVGYCDAGGINLLVFVWLQAYRRGGWVCLIGVQPSVAKVLRIFDLDRILMLYAPSQVPHDQFRGPDLPAVTCSTRPPLRPQSPREHDREHDREYDTVPLRLIPPPTTPNR